jgi:hypothetical protein
MKKSIEYRKGYQAGWEKGSYDRKHTIKKLFSELLALKAQISNYKNHGSKKLKIEYEELLNKHKQFLKDK